MSLVVALSATVAGCDDPANQTAQRDVYSGPNAFENCVADWGNEELCKRQLDEAERKAAASVPTSGASGGGGSHVMLWGPTYYGADRQVYHRGQYYAPTSTRAERTAAFNNIGGGSVKPSSFGGAKPAAYVPRGGFGGAGRSFGGGGSS